MEKISKNTGLIILGVLLTFVLGGMDWLTGHNLNFFVFYFLPVFFAAWFLGSLGAIFFCHPLRHGLVRGRFFKRPHLSIRHLYRLEYHDPVLFLSGDRMVGFGIEARPDP
ncbi:MAG: hypothetical protein LC633_01890 [Desulfobulbaceae bacterium]|nr:hypothetical protein [Desulfobulbaceae bacterium]